MEPKLYLRIGIVTAILVLIAFGVPRFGCHVGHDTYTAPGNFFKFDHASGQEVIQRGIDADKAGGGTVGTVYAAAEEEGVALGVIRVPGILKGMSPKDRTEMMKTLATVWSGAGKLDAQSVETNKLGDGIRVEFHEDKNDTTAYNCIFVVPHKDDMYALMATSTTSAADAASRYQTMLESFEFDPAPKKD